MRMSALFYFVNFIYMEFILHLFFWQNVKVYLLPGVFVILFISALQGFLQSLLKGRGNKIFMGVCLGADYVLFASQMVYRSIFKQPLLIDAALVGGEDALTNYWREALQAILDSGLGLIALALGIVWMVAVYKLWNPEEEALTTKRVAIQSICLLMAGVLLAGSFVLLYKSNEEKYTEYQEFGYPDDVLEDFGVMAFWFRDLDLVKLPEYGEELEAIPQMPDGNTTESNTIENSESTESATSTENVPMEPEAPVYKEQVLNVDYEYLKEIGSDEVDKITDYVFSMKPSKTNEYTGLFEGYNLIYITAEGFSTAAIDGKLTPTLYQLTHSGVVVNEYYVPLWQTSTSDGEYVNLTGLIPDQQFSMTRSAGNSQPFSLANYFKAEGSSCFAYHNNTLSYYDRHLSHPNLGYNFKASKLGDLNEAEWGSSVFQMENANYWPASDLDMFKATIPEYVDEERFHVYYMTVSGHMNYNFRGNRMSSLHYEEVKDLPYSEEGKAYIACNIELDRALAYLIQQLYAAGKLENTVICLSTDHYPYAMNLDNYEELMGMELDNSLDIYRNSLILWNSQMETVEVNEPCGAMDLMPTLLNLFGFEYDSRLYSGRDIFSDSEPLVVFSNRSFISSVASYNKKTGEVVSRTGEPVSEEYISAMKNYVKMLHKHSAGILNNNYYEYFNQAIK